MVCWFDCLFRLAVLLGWVAMPLMSYFGCICWLDLYDIVLYGVCHGIVWIYLALVAFANSVAFFFWFLFFFLFWWFIALVLVYCSFVFVSWWVWFTLCWLTVLFGLFVLDCFWLGFVRLCYFLGCWVLFYCFSLFAVRWFWGYFLGLLFGFRICLMLLVFLVCGFGFMFLAVLLCCFGVTLLMVLWCYYLFGITFALLCLLFILLLILLMMLGLSLDWFIGCCYYESSCFFLVVCVLLWVVLFSWLVRLVWLLLDLLVGVFMVLNSVVIVRHYLNVKYFGVLLIIFVYSVVLNVGVACLCGFLLFINIVLLTCWLLFFGAGLV